MTLHYVDLLHRAWDAMDCRAAVREIYRRAGRPLPEGALDGVDPALWERVRVADRPLDVIASDPLAVGCESHVSVLVSAQPRLALTSSRACGVETVRPWAITRPLGVYRLREARP